MAFHSSIIELSASAYKDNLTFFKEQFGRNVLFSSVVKGNAYGHSIDEFVPMAENAGVEHFSVYSANEANVVKENVLNGPQVMIMGYVDDPELEWAIENNITFFVFELSRLEKALQFAKKIGKPARVHIEVETGMHRTGFEEKEWEQVVSFLKKNTKYFQLEGLCTHFAGAESISNFHRIKHQIEEYDTACNFFAQRDIAPIKKHTCCSAASIRFPEMLLDMARIGILQYGFWPSIEVLIDYMKSSGATSSPLKQVLSWKSKVMSLKNVPMGEYIGYGTSYLATTNTRIAIVPVGYSHGFSRSLSNQGRALINECRVQVIGIVNMNCIALDVSEVPGVEVGTEVVLIGKQGDLEITVSSFSEYSDQLNYELLTRLPDDIPRTVVD